MFSLVGQEHPRLIRVFLNNPQLKDYQSDLIREVKQQNKREWFCYSLIQDNKKQPSKIEKESLFISYLTHNEENIEEEKKQIFLLLLKEIGNIETENQFQSIEKLIEILLSSWSLMDREDQQIFKV